MSLKGRALHLELFFFSFLFFFPDKKGLPLAIGQGELLCIPLTLPLALQMARWNRTGSVVSGTGQRLQQRILDTWIDLLQLQAQSSAIGGCVSKLNSHRGYWLLPKEGNEVKSKRHLRRGNGNKPPPLHSPNRAKIPQVYVKMREDTVF